MIKMMIMIMILYVFVILVVFCNSYMYNSINRRRIVTLMSSNNNMINQNNFIRPLGGYERLLSRKTPNKTSVSLSHGSYYHIKGIVSNDMINKAIIYCMKKHPILRSYIQKNDNNDKLQYFLYCKDSLEDLSNKVHETIYVSSYDELQETWYYLYQYHNYYNYCYHFRYHYYHRKKYLNNALNSPSFPPEGPQWKLTNVIYNNNEKYINESAWIFCFNHGIDDQGSVNIIVEDIVNFCNNNNDDNNNSKIETKQFPPSIEEAIASDLPNIKTIGWALFQLYNSLNFPSLLPFKLFQLKKENINEYNRYADPELRSTFLKFVRISQEETTALLEVCKKKGVSITYILSAAMLLATSAYIQDNYSSQDIRLRFLLSVGLRPYASKYYKELNKINSNDFTNGTVACAAGAIDYIVPISAKTTSYAQSWTGSDEEIEDFFEIAKKSKDLATTIMCFVPESVRLFGLGMDYIDILRVVEMESKNNNNMGRGFSCGVSNMGMVNFDKNKSGNIQVKGGYYGTSHTRNGVLCQLSCMTIDKSFNGCLQFTSPLTSDDEANIYANRFENILRSISQLNLRKQKNVDSLDYDIVCPP